MTAAPRLITSVDEARDVLGAEAYPAVRWQLWRAGVLDYLLHEGQLRCLRAIGASRYRRFVINVGRRWGKSRLMTWCAVVLLWLRMCYRRGWLTREQIFAACEGFEWLAKAATRTKRKARVAYAAPTADMIKEFIEPHMDLMIAHAPPEMGLRKYDGDYVTADGDKIVMKGCEDRAKANRLRGSEADLAIVDEGGFIPILGYVVKSTLGIQLAETRGKMLMPSTPPESPDHPFVNFVAEAEQRGAYYHATTRDAPHITDEMWAELVDDVGGEDTVDAQRELFARIVRDPELVVLPEFGDHLVREHARPSYFLPCIIGDLGFVDMTVIAFGYYDFAADCYVIEDEVAGARMLSDDLDAAIRAKTAELWPGIKVHRRRIDSTARERADLSAEEGEPGDEGQHWNPVSRDGGEAKGRMRAFANKARIACKDGRVAVHPRCQTIIAHAKYARWAPNKRTFARVADENGESLHHYDGCATLLYFLRDCDASTNPYPALPPGVAEVTHYIPPHLRQDDAKAKIRAIFGRGRGR